MPRSLRILTGLLVAVVLVAACAPKAEPTPTPLPSPTPIPSLDGAVSVATEFLQAWEAQAYDQMYEFLSPMARLATSAEAFSKRYRDIASEARMTGLAARVSSVERTMAAAATVTFTLSVDTLLAGPFELENSLSLVHQQGWGVDWSPTAIFPLLVRDNLVHLFVDAPERGAIYDRRGAPLAVQGQLVEIGVVPGQIGDEAGLVQVLSSLLGLSADKVRASYANPGRPDWFMPVGQVSMEVFSSNKDLLTSVAGITWREIARRVYPQGSLASHTVGYLAQISAEALKERAADGYRAGDLLGVAGLEGWGENLLSGPRGAALAIIDPSGRIVWSLAKRAAGTSGDIHTTLDVSLQRSVERILEGRVGAIVAMDVQTGEVLAAASYPGLDPGQLTAGATPAQWQALLNDPLRPFVNRAIAGQYPPGSTFKVVTIAAGMDYLHLTEDTRFFCAGRWDGVADGATRYCWLKTGHGSLNLLEGLIQSCDTVFWEVGKQLNQLDAFAMARMARGFGLGSATGLNALGEAPGLIPDPDFKAQRYTGAEQQWLARDAVNMAIGQGDVLATPLQMANLMAAVANGGTLLQPRLVLGTPGSPDGASDSSPHVIGQLPVSSATMQVIKRGLEGVVTRGTASRAFIGAQVHMAGKSGTSEAPPYESHAWFVGYAPASSPRIAVAVVLEHGGEGGGDAAPLFRKVVEAYMALPSP